MAFTEAGIQAILNPDGIGTQVNIERLVVGVTYSDVYYVGIEPPYAGSSNWLQLANSLTSAQAAAAIQADALAR